MMGNINGYYDENGAFTHHPLMSKVVTVTPVLEAAAQDAGDVIFDAVEIPQCLLAPGGSAILDSIVCVDADDQKAQMHLVLMTALIGLGTKNAAPDITDAEALANVIGHVELLAASYVDLGGASVLTKLGLAMPVQGASGSRSLWVAGFTTGTPTYSVGGLRLRFGFRYR